MPGPIAQTVGGNFGAFTSNRPAGIVKALGCESTIIGHCEERRDKAGMLAKGYKCGFRFPEKGVWTGKSRRIPLANRI